MAYRSTSCEGFAYLWTLMLVAFMGVGLVIASEVYTTSVRRDKERELLFIGHEFRTAIEHYYKAGAGGPAVYPQTLEQLVRDPRFPNPRRHLRRIYADPITGKKEWGTVLVQGRIVGVYSLSQQAPVKQDNFEPSDTSFRLKPRYADWTFVYPFDMFTAPKPN
ncbi:MAG: type II secretion system protein [Pseudomonadota bacterium]